MTDTTSPVEQTHHLDVPGAALMWDVRRNDESMLPILLMVGYPMGASGFGSQAPHFTDRTVVTFDPRGIERSVNQGSDLSLVDQNVEDLHAVIEAIRDEFGGRAIDVFASSGGAVTALALVAARPDDIRTLVAHEPPSLGVLDDREAAQSAWGAVRRTYQDHGGTAGMAHFIALTSHHGPFPDDWADQPGPDPATFGMPSGDDGSRDDPLLGQGDDGVPDHPLPLDGVAASSTRVVIGVGEETGQQMTGRTSRAVAQRLGTEVVVFPGDHGGFLGGEYGQMGQPDAFAARLREVLDAS